MNCKKENRNKRFLKRALALCCALSIIVTSMTALAAPTVEGNGEGDGGGQATQVVVGGPRANKTGWLVYMVDSAGRQVGQTRVLYSSGERPGDDYIKLPVTAFGVPTNNFRGTDWAGDYWQPAEPFTTSGSGNGSAIKSFLVQEGQEVRHLNVVEKLFGETIKKQYANESGEEQPLFMILEPFYWAQMYIGNRASGIYLCATAKGWGQMQKSYEKVGMPVTGSPLIRRYTNNIFPNCVRLQTTQLGKTPYSGPRTNEQMASETSGNGIMIFTAHDGLNGTIPGEGEAVAGPGTFGPGAETRQLYAIQNWSEEYDIDQAIPSSETVNNKYEADSFYGNCQVEGQTIRRTYGATYTYKWTEREKYRAGTDSLTLKPIYKYRDVTRKKSVPVVFTASVSYQVIKKIQLYDLMELAVSNKALPDDVVYDKNNSSEWADVTAEVRIYKGDYAYSTMTSYHGMGVSGENHAYLPPSSYIGDRTIEVSGSPSDSRINQDKQSAMASVYNASWSRNDNVKVTLSNGLSYTFMEDTKLKGCSISDYDPKSSASNSRYAYGGNGITLASVQPFRDKGSSSHIIPPETDNANYPTGVQVKYTSMVNSVGNYGALFRAGKGIYPDDINTDDIYRHVIGGLDGTKWNRVDKPGGDGYDIKVHTPAVAPFYITNYVGVPQVTPDEQLLDVDPSAAFQLKLDQQYMLRFNPDQWASFVYGEVKGYHQDLASYPSIYDKYVQEKQVKFPFDVYYEGEFYEADTWITVLNPDSWDTLWSDGVGWDYDNYESSNHWQMMPFYIPSYAEEKTGTIQVRVFAHNVEGRYEGSHNVITAMQLRQNTEQDNYIATYDQKSQVSGHIYGFTVTGVDDTEMYHGVDVTEDFYNRQEFPLCPGYEERVSGIYNRFGEPDLRYQTDGSLTKFVIGADGKPQPAYNLLPLREGSNENVPGRMGDGKLYLGTGFSFNLKTIANLWNDNDYVQIIPTYKFYSKEDGSLVDSIRMEGDDIISTTNRLRLLYMENVQLRDYFGEQKYLVWHDSMIGDDKCRESYYTPEDNLTSGGITYRYGGWPEYTIDRYNQTHHLYGTDQRSYFEHMYMAHPSYTNAKIVLGWQQRLLSGEWEQLRYNRKSTDTGLATYTDWNRDGYYDTGIGSEEITRFRDSMQTWYGCYDMPGKLYIYDDIKR